MTFLLQQHKIGQKYTTIRQRSVNVHVVAPGRPGGELLSLQQSYASDSKALHYSCISASREAGRSESRRGSRDSGRAISNADSSPSLQHAVNGKRRREGRGVVEGVRHSPTPRHPPLQPRPDHARLRLSFQIPSRGVCLLDR